MSAGSGLLPSTPPRLLAFRALGCKMVLEPASRPDTSRSSVVAGKGMIAEGHYCPAAQIYRYLVSTLEASVEQMMTSCVSEPIVV